MDEHEEINWNEVIEWDKEYHLKIFKTEDEYQCVPIEHTEGDYLVTTRFLCNKIMQIILPML